MNIRLYHFYLLFCIFAFQNVASAENLGDSTVSAFQKTNIAFNGIYRQNVTQGFFGNEYGNPIHSTLVADLNPNVILYSSNKSKFFVLFSPGVKLRLLDAYKSPVRSPSYMPGAKIYYRINADITKPEFLSIAYSHHSNGQDGRTLDSSGNFNRGKGKFTTNYYTADYTTGKRSVSSTMSKSHYQSIGIELHTGLFNKGFSPELKNNYGFVRLNGSYIYDILKDNTGSDKYQSHQRIQARLMYIADRYNGYKTINLIKRLNASVQYNYQFGFMDNVALSLAAGYRGQDDYNIYFEDSYSYISVGIVYGVAFSLDKKRHVVTR